MCMSFSVSALVIGAPGKRVDAAPKAGGCFGGGTQEIFRGVSENWLGGTGKAEAAKLPGAGIIPKQCPMERVETEARHRTSPAGIRNQDAQEQRRDAPSYSSTT